jgi:PhoPQ-activated pathogenicity-related protein
MTSQRWLTDADFAENSEVKSLWWHYLVVIVPDNLQWKANGTLWITDGTQHSSLPDAHNYNVALAAGLALTTGTITGSLFQIPNEKITFASDPLQKGRSEDAIIAFTWDHFLKDPSNPEWLVRFPMVKASVRAMDAMQEFVRTKLPETGATLDSFAVSGASKRGWTTWLVGAVDPQRVKVIVPIVLDAINFVAVEHHQYRSYGGWTYALSDYLEMDIMSRLDDPNMKLLQENEDPYFYRDRLTMPKLIINAAMDEFQQPDDTHYWWNDMPEPKHFFIVPNAEHALVTGIFAAIPSVSAFLTAQLYQTEVPQFDWTINSSTGEIVTTLHSGKLYSANVWWAYSCGNNQFDNNDTTTTPTLRRDYRIAHLDNPCACGILNDGMCTNFKALWNKKSIESTLVKGKRTFSVKFDAPEDGRWIAFLMDFKFFNENNHYLPNSFTVEDFKKIYEREPPNSPAGKIALAYADYFDNFGGLDFNFAHFFEFTTEVSVFPDTFPCKLDHHHHSHYHHDLVVFLLDADCQGSACGQAPMV